MRKDLVALACPTSDGTGGFVGELDIECRRDQCARVALFRVVEDLLSCATFNQMAIAHHNDFIAECAHHTEVMADKQVRQAMALLQLA